MKCEEDHGGALLISFPRAWLHCMSCDFRSEICTIRLRSVAITDKHFRTGVVHVMKRGKRNGPFPGDGLGSRDGRSERCAVLMHEGNSLSQDSAIRIPIWMCKHQHHEPTVAE